MSPATRLCTALLLTTLSGCATFKDAVNPYNEDFKCRARGDSGQCIDTPTAYDKARHPARLRNSTTAPGNLLRLRLEDKRYRTITGLLKQPRKPILQPPQILRVLLLPYEGEGEELFMSRYVYLKLERSSWLLTDPDAVTRGAQ